MKKPVIATDVGGDKEMMDDGRTGFLVRRRECRGYYKKNNCIY